MSSSTKTVNWPVKGDESIMNEKEHGTCPAPPQKNLRFSVDWNVADKISCFNRHYAEYSGYFLATSWLNDVEPHDQPWKYYDSITGKLLFTAPGPSRSFEEFLAESTAHGWPSFRDEEVEWENVRVLADGETVSVDGTHLGHNLPDANGNR